jgi:hypothetical protein
MLAAVLAVALALSASPAVSPREPYWRVDATASGTYAVDYGADRDLVDGQAGGSWRWRMRALASGYAVDTDLTNFRMTTRESSSVVLPDGSPYCRPPASKQIGWVRDDRVGLYFDSRRRGFQVDHPFATFLTGCHAGAHGMTLYDGASPAITVLPRSAFRPRKTRNFEHTWTQQIALDRSHDPGQDTHTFTATASITITLERIDRRAAQRLRVHLRRAPRHEP